MSTRLSNLFVLPLAATLLLGACGGDSGSPFDPDDGAGVPSGSFSFSYDGPMQAGQFNVQGAARLNGDGSWAVGNWAVGARVGSDGQQMLAGYATRQQGSRHDFLTLMVVGNQAGEYDVGEACSRDCAMVGIAFGLQQGNPTGLEHSCVLQTGKVRITSLDVSRIRGTISGTGICASVGGGTAAFEMSGGTFDLPIPFPSAS